MAKAHERFEELAVGHVLGGLDPVDAAEFRSHLVGCRTCRAHVSELRDLASELAAAEREERVAARLKTEVVRREEPSEEGGGGWHITPAFLLLALTVVGSLAVGLGLWNYHLRSANAALVDTTTMREATLESLGRGEAVPATFAPGVTGLVVRDGAAFAATLGGVPSLVPGEILVVWLVGDDGQARAVHYDSRTPEGGRLALRDDHGGAVTLLVTVQPSPVTSPAGRELVNAELTGP